MGTETTTGAAVVMPVGPGTVLEHLKDSLGSTALWMPGSAVVADDDSGEPALSERARFPGITWLSSGEQGGGTGGGVLHLVLCEGYRYVAGHTAVHVVVEVDTGAVITGSSTDRDAAERSRRRPRVGLLGSSRTTGTGAARGSTPAAEAVVDEARLLRRCARPAARTVRGLLRRAHRNGCETGNRILGGTSFASRACLHVLRGEGPLDLPVLARTRGVEDHLRVRAVGFRDGDLVVGGDPSALAWRGLPLPAENGVARGKAVAHSASGRGDPREDEVRAVSRDHRKESAA